MAEEKPLRRRLVLRWAKSVNRILVTGTVAAIVVLAARLFNGSADVEVWEVGPIPLKAVWVVFAGGTLVHAFAGYFFRRAALELQRSSVDVSQKLAAYEDVVADGGHYVGVAVPRVPVEGRRTVAMDLRDPSTWVAHGGALAVAGAVLPWWWDDGLQWPGLAQSLALAGIGVLLVAVNWVIGGHWALALSTVGSPVVVSEPFALAAFGKFSGPTLAFTTIMGLLPLIVFLLATTGLAAAIWAGLKWFL